MYYLLPNNFVGEKQLLRTPLQLLPCSPWAGFCWWEAWGPAQPNYGTVADLEMKDGGRNQGSGGRKSPSGVQEQSSGGGLGAKPPEADDIL